MPGIMSNATNHLIRLTNEYARAAGVGVTTTSRRLFQDSKKLAAIHKGADITTARFEAAVQWLSSNWPEGAEWPEGIHRPEPATRQDPEPAECQA